MKAADPPLAQKPALQSPPLCGRLYKSTTLRRRLCGVAPIDRTPYKSTHRRTPLGRSRSPIQQPPPHAARCEGLPFFRSSAARTSCRGRPLYKSALRTAHRGQPLWNGAVDNTGRGLLLYKSAVRAARRSHTPYKSFVPGVTASRGWSLVPRPRRAVAVALALSKILLYKSASQDWSPIPRPQRGRSSFVVLARSGGRGLLLYESAARAV